MNRQKTVLARWLRAASVALVALGAAAVAQAQNAIESITSSVQSGTEVIRIDFSEPLSTLPTGFNIQSPARVALDFPGVGNAMGRTAVDFNLGNLRSANVVQAGEILAACWSRDSTEGICLHRRSYPLYGILKE